MTTLQERNKISQQKRRERPEVKEADRQNSRRLRANPEYKKKEIEKKQANWLDLRTWPMVALRNIKARARKKGIPFDLEAKDIVVPEYCPVLGIPLASSLGVSARTKPNSPSVDRFDNNKGYTKDNIRVISMRANVLKSNGTVEEFEALLKYMKGELS